tara:strand:+ start:213 stop:497 length:285 start_codon:yes stop_codon:yes gene_type:complete
MAEKYYQIYFCYDRKYITGNAPRGIFKKNDNKYVNLISAEKDFIISLLDREKDSKYEYGWDLEYRLSILFINNDIKHLYKSDYDDDFWIKQLGK